MLTRLRQTLSAIRHAATRRRGAALADNLQPAPVGDERPNRLQVICQSNTEGPGIWKWKHYHSIYARHLGKFVGAHATVCEVGVYSGGSIKMWQDYLTGWTQYHGVDIEPACKAYGKEFVAVIHIGDQADRSFWEQFRADVPKLDVLIDDGGHTPEQQMTTMEEMLPHLQPGGVYICEDIHGAGNPMTQFAMGLADRLNAFTFGDLPAPRQERTAVQRCINSVHLYPYMVVVEKLALSPVDFVCPRHGTQWQPFYEQVDHEVTQ